MSIVFLDTETVPDPDRIATRQWSEYREKHGKADSDAALHPAFANVVCVCARDDGAEPRRFTACGADEREILLRFAKTFGAKDIVLCGWGLKHFDIPMLACRLLAYGIPLPPCLRVNGKKPWEVAHADLCDDFRFGGGQRISLDAACLMLGLPSPKEQMSGADVHRAFAEGRFEDIATYCMGDVDAAARIHAKLKEFT